jgi:hypothetical protein
MTGGMGVEEAGRATSKDTPKVRGELLEAGRI